MIHFRTGIVVLATTMALAGCAAPTATLTPTEQVRAGDCKNQVVGEELISISDTSPTVDCRKPHTLEAYAVVRVPAPLDSLGPRRPGPEMLDALAGRTCPLDALRSYLGVSDLDAIWGIDIKPRYPTEGEWAHGVRTMVCYLINNRFSDRPPTSELPLRAIMTTPASARVRLCRNADAVLLTCDRPHIAESAGDVAGAPGTSAAAACRPRVEQYLGGPLPTGYRIQSEPQPDGGHRCWVASTAGQTRGTLRSGLSS